MALLNHSAAIIDTDLLEAIRHLGLTEPAIMVPVVPVPMALVGHCYKNVQKKVEMDGGNVLLGWHFFPKTFLISAEYHAVWESPDGQIVDITPNEGEETSIIFIPHGSTTYDGNQIENFYYNYRQCQLVENFISLEKLNFKFENTGYRKDVHPMAFTEEDSNISLLIQVSQFDLRERIQNGFTCDTVCCDGPHSYQQCCHLAVQDFIDEVEKSIE